jgi:hypothetical protein
VVCSSWYVVLLVHLYMVVIIKYCNIQYMNLCSILMLVSQVYVASADHLRTYTWIDMHTVQI